MGTGDSVGTDDKTPRAASPSVFLGTGAKITAIVIGTVILGSGGGYAYLALRYPRQRAPATESVAATPERIERGRYLAEHVLDCMGCHSRRDFARFGFPSQQGTRGAGGDCFDESFGFPGRICTRNITPDATTGIGGWTEGELMRAIREGVGRDGEALFPMMPYRELRTLSDDDTRAVVAYVRTVPAVANALPPRELGFALGLMVRMVPEPLPGPVPDPDRTDPVAYGRYLAVVARCEACHTSIDQDMALIRDKRFAGGHEFASPAGTVRSTNITPHVNGIGSRSRAEFIAIFRVYADVESAAVPVSPEQNTPMPWLAYGGMTDQDLGAIYDFLRTVPPSADLITVRTITAAAAAPGGAP